MIFLGFGSNMPSSFGNRFENIELAISYLKNENIKVEKISSFYETPSYPDKKNPKFINTVIKIVTDLSPIDLASIIINIEKKLERVRKYKNDPRTCDIDILDYNGKIINFKSENLIFSVPHSLLSFRNFVLYPLQEIYPNWVHPKTNEPISILIENLPKEDKNSILKIKKS
tara:strand:- start:30 stop:542 length:513 start_codon:yes stop_codon:yes gene_type:complete